jgi:protease IV
MFTSARPFTNAERSTFSTMIDLGYQDFLQAVASGRKMTVEQVRAVAKGRVWTGAQAKERGLVDELGGLDVAIDKAKALAGIDAKTQVTLKLYPAQKSPLQLIQQALGVSGEAARGAALIAGVMSDPRLQATMRAVQPTAGVRAHAPAMEIR